ncbi:arabinogalactan endo-beta-1,4-galactanase [Parastagonospora nodorum]|nr:arabinogalactan endo-beta-1,4-galactanase [Parastagonospora nodorum]KAH4258636.1 arabinogalactan endo-beta-1,4-galactanase [Parastagonospora nodorum]KAH4272039.1 arabinogalactan endo-beta-1,4-galactanase [Parastagonospora nodorum]KAH5166008.1 arabinogalactan endo-beta-1,4-galactanase [Parastagonospora nodorum]KAH5175834.1 arabinogalactan endo-beta-1,4-galactanase [Parastagonospora nodorum]
MRLPSLLILAATALAALPFKGVDWSSLLIEEKAGKTYKNSAGQTQPLETILKSSGVNTVRQRIWVNPSDGNYNLDYNIKLAKRAKAAGLKIYLDFHYSDSWADPGKQVVPAAWKSLSKDALVKQVYDYTKNVINTFATNGLGLDIVSIGNEITPGLLFPVGKLGSGEGAANVAALLKSASRAIKESNMSPKPQIMIHLDNGWKWDTQKWWYDTILAAGLSSSDFDIQGISYYPFYNAAATLSALSSSMNNMASRYGKQVMVVETNWPSYCPNPSTSFPSDTTSIPISVDGQTQWMKELAKRVVAVPNGKGTGLFYWEPAWIDNAPLGSSCGWNLMVGDDGKVMSSLAVFGSI